MASIIQRQKTTTQFLENPKNPIGPQSQSLACPMAPSGPASAITLLPNIEEVMDTAHQLTSQTQALLQPKIEELKMRLLRLSHFPMRAMHSYNKRLLMFALFGL